MTDGYWALISEETAKSSDTIFSGSVGDFPSLCACPNCNAAMFPVLSFQKKTVPVAPQNDDFFDKGGWMTLDVCPHCPHWLSNYVVHYRQGRRSASGGYRTGTGRDNLIDMPFQSRSVRLQMIDQRLWATGDEREDYYHRRYLEGVYHQLGGERLRADQEPCQSCENCNSALLFFGVIDNDDLNVPLYAGGEPHSLIIGDMKSLNMYVCEACASVTYCISE